jgi:hypothetical protein
VRVPDLAIGFSGRQDFCEKSSRRGKLTVVQVQYCTVHQIRVGGGKMRMKMWIRIKVEVEVKVKVEVEVRGSETPYVFRLG